VDPIQDLSLRLDRQESRISALELNEQEQSRLIDAMAERQELLLGVVRVLDQRIKMLFGGSILLAAAIVFLLLRHRV
jgi:hypothetical protein